ncbi:MAG: hypothetical protein GC189_06870 [Alphaproteobacteria bacterium]|nr:hypothetical protein [Alphaproteobacteria bacterium]
MRTLTQWIVAAATALLAACTTPMSSAPPAPTDQVVVTGRRVITPVLVEIRPTEARTPRQGGSAVVILGPDTFGEQNAAVCVELYRRFDEARRSEVLVGARRGENGETELLRPIYWPLSVRSGPEPQMCLERIQGYDFARATALKRKFGLTAAGPFLVVERFEPSRGETLAAVIDMTRLRADDIAAAVQYFSEGFSQRNDIWDPQIYEPARQRQDIASFFGVDRPAFHARLLQVTQHVGCPLANLLDVCSPAQ